jgi:hypothetical protein
MNNRIKGFGLGAFYVAVIFLAGCFPEDSLQWSEDGSIGLLRIDDALYIVDGNSGELTEVEKPYVSILPDISDDGKLIAYCQVVKCSNPLKDLKALPPGQVKMIKYYAEQTKNNILDAGGLTDGKFPFPEEGILLPHEYRNWAIRYLCENADDKLLEVLGKEGIEKGKEEEFGYFQIVVAQAKAPEKKRIAATSIFHIVATRLSPDGKSVAYLMHTQEGEVSNEHEEFGLYVASLDSDIKAMLVDSRVAIFYDWRPDSKAIAYMSADSKNLLHDNFIVGTLEERTVANANDKLLAEATELGERGSAGTHKCTGKTLELAGVIFNPWLKVAYGADRRLFFSSVVLTLPTSTRDEGRWSVFCYDPVPATIADVLPASVSSYASEEVDMLMFSMSPDGKNVLLPTKNNRFIRYTLGTDSMEVPIGEGEAYGDENVSAFLTVWKGNDEISYLASENSRFLTKDKEEPHKRKEIVILGADGKFRRVLSENWPDKLLK